MLTGPENVCVIDGDTLEEKNLNRQLFSPEAIGMNKAEALAGRYGCGHLPDWFNPGLINFSPADWLFVCVDNNPARIAALDSCDSRNCSAIIAANERTSAESLIYFRSWKGTPRDPRILYPEYLTDKSGDPQRAGMGCTGLAQQQTPQLVSANFIAAALAQHLFVCWAMELPNMDNIPAVIPHLPHKLSANLSKLESFKTGEVKL